MNSVNIYFIKVVIHLYFANKYKEQIKHNRRIADIVNDFDYILNNMWCSYSFGKGYKRWKEISNKIDIYYRNKISTEIGHVDIGHGKQQALIALREEMINYIDHLSMIK